MRGQSVALIKFSVAQEPYVKTNVKYAFGPQEKGKRDAKGRVRELYAEMRNGTDIRHPETGAVLRYEGSVTLRKWIDRAGTYEGDEKTCVDELVAENPTVIDLEMGLPKIALRMDCVALEPEGDTTRVVFWEAKMIDEPRLRSRSRAGVITQLKRYKDFLADDCRALSVEIGYQNACTLLNDIHGMAAQFPDQHALDPLVIAVARGTSVLKVDPMPRLVIFGGKEYQKKGNWDLHRNRLEAEKIPCLGACRR